MRDYRKRLKENGKGDAMREKDKLRKRQERVTMKSKRVSGVKLAHQRMLNRERVQKYRAKVKIAESNKNPGGFGSNQALGKAVARSLKNFPNSPSKRKAVVKKLAENYGLIEPVTKPKNILNQDTVNAINIFYNRDDISQQAPGKRDYVTIWNQNGKERVQKRHLLYTLNEVHTMFKEAHSDLPVGRSKFASLRPSHVLYRHLTPKNVCLCLYHENINLICEALHKEFNEFPLYSNNFVNNFVCSPEIENCMFGNCDNCKGHFDKFCGIFKGIKFNNEIVWYEWMRVDYEEKKNSRRKVSNPGSQTSSKMDKCLKNGTVADVFDSLQEKMPYFLYHVYIKREQSNYFQLKLVSIPERNAVVQVDFSENYSLEFQNEIQSAHWNQDQLSLFTSSSWLNQLQISKVFVSDDLEHDKVSVLVYMHMLLSKLVTEYNIKVVDVFSDGPSSQFKNQYIFNALPWLIRKCGLDELHWHFFATSHGKGAVDAIGGTVKREVWMGTLSGNVMVNSLEDFCKSANQKNKKIVVEAVSQDEMKKQLDNLGLQHLFQQSSPISDIKKMHYVGVTSETYAIETRNYSNQVEELNSVEPESDDEWYDKTCDKISGADLKVGCYVLVEYEAELFPGVITCIMDKWITVKAMEKCKGGWRWPEKDDVIDYERDKVVRMINFPVPINNRGTFRVPELEEKWGI